MDTWLVVLILGQLAFVSFLIWLGTHASLRKNQQRSEERLRILERFASAEELSAFLASPGGKDFLHVFGRDRTPGDPRRTVLTALGVGIVTALLGGGFLLLTGVEAVDDRAGFFVPGILASLGGIGILIAAVVTWVGIRRWGLDPRRDDVEL